ncbi:hypothetical protein KsCSTR_02360 [Candidatus Kuenenia stuttgartiensis]|uniref:Uncharacterized protein n=1 Tax=Kuenenia stuttgartiensis TaxID=174633 RepID=A0A6G7GJB6_KUEST|nr:hypothetical protein KsCSTR_02360 [Candidatus Kuenenia stuttgartiensis]
MLGKKCIKNIHDVKKIEALVMAIEKCTRWQSKIVPLWTKRFIITI